MIRSLKNLIMFLASLAELKISVNDLGSGASQQPSHSELQNKSRPTPNDPNLVPNSAARSEGELSALSVLVQNCKSLDRLCDLAGLIVDDDNELLLCDVCNSCESSNASLRSRPGSFHYDFSLGTDFTATNQPTQFVNLKRSVSRHITQRKTHLNIVAEKEEDNEKRRKMQAKQQTVGVTVGKQVYKALKLGRPFADFETDMQLLSSANVNVGNLNHSRKFASSMRPSFTAAVDSRIKKYLQKPLPATGTVPPVGIIADKVTTKRRTGHMYGAVMFTPNMPNLLTPVSLGMVAVKGHTGECIANDVRDICNQYNLRNHQIAGFGFDGQYFKLNVPGKLKDKLNLDGSVNFVWDAAHLLQLADKDMRKEVPWIESICKDIGAVLHKFAYGKTYEAAIEKANELGIDLKAPLWFSETRFAAYAHNVFKNFIDNYAVVHRVLEELRKLVTHVQKMHAAYYAE